MSTLVIIAMAVLLSIPFYIILLVVQNKIYQKLRIDFEKFCDEVVEEAIANSIKIQQEMERIQNQFNDKS